jgi:hypothetical protein
VKVSKKEVQNDPVWTREAYIKVCELLVVHNNGSKKQFIDEFLASNLPTVQNRAFTKRQLNSKYPAIRKKLINIGVLPDGSKFINKRPADVISDAELLTEMTTFLKKRRTQTRQRF